MLMQQLSLDVEPPGLCERSGEVCDNRPLVAFLYQLMEYHLPAGKVEEILADCLALPEEEESTSPREFDSVRVFDNGWLASYAKDVADRLAGGVAGAATAKPAAEPVGPVEPPAQPVDAAHEALMLQPLERLFVKGDPHVHAEKALHSLGAVTIGDVLKLTEAQVLNCHGMGEHRLWWFVRVLEKRGLKLAGKL